jgi:hypothetical protein
VEPEDEPAKVVTSPSPRAAAIRGWDEKEQRARVRVKGREESIPGPTKNDRPRNDEILKGAIFFQFA